MEKDFEKGVLKDVVSFTLFMLDLRNRQQC